MIQNYLKKAVVISSTRFIALSLATVDMVMLGHTSLSEVQEYTVASQTAQVLVILAVVLSIGVNIIVGKNKHCIKRVGQEVIGYSLLVGLVLSMFGICLGLFIDSFIGFNQSYDILCLSILPLTVYIGLANILESSGLERAVLSITIASSVFNALFNLIAISLLDNAAIAVALSTLLVRFGALIPIVVLGRKHNLISFPVVSITRCRELFCFGRSEAFTSLFFTGGIAALVIFFNHNYDQETVAVLGFSLNFMNTFSVLYVGLMISLSICLSQIEPQHHSDYPFMRTTLTYIIFTATVLLSAVDIIAQVYTPSVKAVFVDALVLSVVVIMADGVALALIAWLRVRGFTQLPPLFRLAMIMIGLPCSFIFSVNENATVNVIAFMAIGTIIAAFLTISYFCWRVYQAPLVHSASLSESSLVIKRPQ